jgi:hypothetical protein
MKLSLLIPALALIAAPALAHPQRPDSARMDRPARADSARTERPQAERPRAERASRDAAPTRAGGSTNNDRPETTRGGGVQRENLCKKGDCTAHDRSDEK